MIIITVVTGFCFGIMHMQNVFVGQSLVETAFQSLNAACMGMLFAAVYLRGGNIWALMLIHAFIDTGSMAANLLTKTYHSSAIESLASKTDNTVDPATTGAKIVLCVLYVAMAFFVLRKSKCQNTPDH